MPKKPAPFRRPSIEISTGPKRSWAWVSPDALAEGDTIADFGVVSKVTIHRRPQSHNTVILTDGYESGLEPIESIEITSTMGSHEIFSPTDVVHAFVLSKE